jgi:hypothetical protein
VRDSAWWQWCDKNGVSIGLPTFVVVAVFFLILGVGVQGWLWAVLAGGIATNLAAKQSRQR